MIIEMYRKIFRPTSARSAGLTMIELLIVIVILALLLILLALLMRTQLSKTRDAQRKADLEKIKISFEDYYNDNGCYPEQNDYYSWRCGTNDFSPYLATFPCDPVTKTHYAYIVNQDSCAGYAVMTQLENTTDPSIERVGCTADGCGEFDYNYGISAGFPFDTFLGSGSQSAAHACYEGICNYYHDPGASGCFRTSQLVDCGGCGASETWCSE